MFDAANRMMAQGKAAADAPAPASIFGSAAGLSQSIEREDRFRIAFYPIACASSPDLAMGLAACIACLLEQSDDLKVYRVFARIDPEDDSDEISSDDCQFSPEQWELQGLDDNVLIYGQLAENANGFQLTLSLDLSLIGEGGALDFTVSAATLADLIGQLPAVAADLTAELELGGGSQLIVDYPPPTSESEILRELLEAVFGWNLDLYLRYWGLEWAEADIQAQYREAEAICARMNEAFGYWCLGMMAQQVLGMEQPELSEAMLPLLAWSQDADAVKSAGLLALSLGLAHPGGTERAIAMLQPLLADPADARVWRRIADLHSEAGHAARAIEVCQEALEAGCESLLIYWRYVELLSVAEANGWLVEDVMLIDPDEIAEEEQIACEIVGALKRITALDPENLEALQLAIAQMVDSEDDEIWLYFERLAALDREALFLVEVIDRLLDLDDLSPAYDILRSRLDDEARKPALYACLAQLAVHERQFERAMGYIDEARASQPEGDDELELDLQRLELMAALPDFESRFAEIKITLANRRAVPERDVDLLESAIEIAPRMIDLYLALSDCYSGWNDHESALEVLSDAQAVTGAHPLLILGRTRGLWRSGQRDEAMRLLNDGIAAFPNAVSLLGQMAGYLIDNDQLDDARAYMERAESIAPSSAALMQLRRLIASKVAR